MGSADLVTPSMPEPLAVEHACDAFDCGKASLNSWLKTRALTNQLAGYTVVMVSQVAGRVVGYYGLTPTGVSPAAAPRSVRGGQPPNPLPAILLGQLAVDRSWAGQGLGVSLTIHALERCLAGAAFVGGRAVVVRAVDDPALAWWRHWGFHSSRDDLYLLFLRMNEVARTLASTKGEL